MRNEQWQRTLRFKDMDFWELDIVGQKLVKAHKKFNIYAFVARCRQEQNHAGGI